MAGVCPAVMPHKWYFWKDGILFVSRFWIVYAQVDGQFKKTLRESARGPDMGKLPL